MWLWLPVHPHLLWPVRPPLPHNVPAQHQWSDLVVPSWASGRVSGFYPLVRSTIASGASGLRAPPPWGRPSVKFRHDRWAFVFFFFLVNKKSEVLQIYFMSIVFMMTFWRKFVLFLFLFNEMITFKILFQMRLPCIMLKLNSDKANRLSPLFIFIS